MKLKGKKLEGPNVCTLYLPRGNDEVIVIKARAVLDYKEFTEKIPEPKPPEKIVRGGGKQLDYDNPSFQQEVADYNRLRTHWMIIQSLKAWEDAEWEKVDYADPNTWSLYEEEMKDSGFSEVERQRIIGLVIEANCLNEAKLTEARERFLTAQAATVPLNGLSSLKEGPMNMPSGEVAKDLTSVRQTS